METITKIDPWSETEKEEWSRNYDVLTTLLKQLEDGLDASYEKTEGIDKWDIARHTLETAITTLEQYKMDLFNKGRI